MGERGPQPGEGGAPPKWIDLDVVKRAASLGATIGEIAVLTGVGRRTFHTRLEKDETLKAAIEEGRERGRMALRRLQWQRANAGSDTMLIWLGKQLLGQRDKHDVVQEVGVSVTFQHLVAMREIGERIVAELMMQQGGTVIDGSSQPLNAGNSTELTPPLSVADLGSPARE